MISKQAPPMRNDTVTRSRYWLLAKYVLAGTLLTLTGCVVGPDFTPPEVHVPHNYLHESTPTHTTSGPGADGIEQVFVRAGAVQADWYRLFRSRTLNDLIHTALTNSPTLAAANARVRAARADLGAQHGRLLPQLGAGAGVSRKRLNGSQIGLSDPAFSNIFDLFQGQLTLNYDLDLFGITQRGIEAESARLAVQRYRLLDSYLTLTNNVVATALAEAATRAQIQATRKLIASHKQSLALLSQQEQNGAVAGNAVLRARAQLAQVQTELAPLQKQLSITQHRMAVLTGTTPAAYPAPKLELSDFKLPARLPVSLPSDLVRQRPDILAAESLLHAANAQVGVATARLLPQISITGALGRDALSFSGLFDPIRTVYNIAAGLSAPLYEGGRLRAQKRAAQARLAATTADYQATVLNAFAEVADQLRALQSDADDLAAQQRALAAAQDNLQLVHIQLNHGAVDNLDLFAAQNLYTRALLSQTGARVQRYRDTAGLFRALGGGWWTQAAGLQPTTVQAAAGAASGAK